ncbi:MAG: porphobilinogen synthase [Deltaproteobacteria bacterium]|nr:porphobilinogen synthase [Deltaproteobacteria bacterium]
MSTFPAYPTSRPRRLRTNQNIRALLQETRLSISDLICPIFVRHDSEKRPVQSMPGQYQHTLQSIVDEVKKVEQLGLKAIMLFGIPEKKDPEGSDNLSPNGIATKAIQIIKKTCPDLLVISDLCLCDYSDHGHCCIIDPANKTYLNEPTLEYLAKAAVIHAQAGADMLAPSGMMDGTVKAIRHRLDETGFTNTSIMCHSSKYASVLYGPFREAAECTIQFGDRKTYQIDPPNAREALKEMHIDIAEGADILMVKPASFYLDIIRQAHDNFETPIAAYQVSGEYSMIHAAADKGWLDLKSTTLESLMAIKRAGAQNIVTYFAKEAAQWIS